MGRRFFYGLHLTRSDWPGGHPFIYKKGQSPAIQVQSEWPKGRCVQIDVTRLSLRDAVSWVYLVEDVASQMRLASSVDPTVAQERTALTLQEGRNRLVSLGHDEPAGGHGS